MYFETKIQPRLSEEIENLKNSGVVEESLVTINRITRQCWEGESEEVRQEVFAAVEEEHQRALAALEIEKNDTAALVE
jgi:hypothetical protein